MGTFASAHADDSDVSASEKTLAIAGVGVRVDQFEPASWVTYRFGPMNSIQSDALDAEKGSTGAKSCGALP